MAHVPQGALAFASRYAQTSQSSYTMGGLKIGKIIDVHRDTYTVDLAMSTGEILRRVRVSSNLVGTRAGSLYIQSISNPNKIKISQGPLGDFRDDKHRTVFALVGFISEDPNNPVIVGFITPLTNQMFFDRPGFSLDRHESDLYTMIENGPQSTYDTRTDTTIPNYEFYHPSGFFTRIGQGTEHEDLTHQDVQSRAFFRGTPNALAPMRTAGPDPGDYVPVVLKHPSGTGVTINNEGILNIQTGPTGHAQVNGCFIIHSCNILGGNNIEIVEGPGDQITIQDKLILAGSHITLDEEPHSITINAEWAPEYQLPIASPTLLGGIKVGDGLAIDETSGILSNAYRLPIASSSVLGGIRVGATLTIDPTTGILDYTLPPATRTTRGGVLVDKTDLSLFHNTNPVMINKVLSPVTYGVSIRSDIDTAVTQIAYYRFPSQDDTVTAGVFDAFGELLDDISFDEEPTDPGWHWKVLKTPIPIEANTDYTIAVFSPGGFIPFENNDGTEDIFYNQDNFVSGNNVVHVTGAQVNTAASMSFPNSGIDTVFSSHLGSITLFLDIKLDTTPQTLTQEGLLDAADTSALNIHKPVYIGPRDIVLESDCELDQYFDRDISGHLYGVPRQYLTFSNYVACKVEAEGDISAVEAFVVDWLGTAPETARIHLWFYFDTGGDVPGARWSVDEPPPYFYGMTGEFAGDPKYGGFFSAPTTFVNDPGWDAALPSFGATLWIVLQGDGVHPLVWYSRPNPGARTVATSTDGHTWTSVPDLTLAHRLFTTTGAAPLTMYGNGSTDVLSIYTRRYNAIYANSFFGFAGNFISTYGKAVRAETNGGIGVYATATRGMPLSIHQGTSGFCLPVENTYPAAQIIRQGIFCSGPGSFTQPSLLIDDQVTSDSEDRLLVNFQSRSVDKLTLDRHGNLRIAGSLTAPSVAVGSGGLTLGGIPIFPSPLTTKGDIWVYGSGNTRLPVGANTYTIFADSTTSTGLRWGPSAGGGSGGMNWKGDWSPHDVCYSVNDVVFYNGVSYICIAPPAGLLATYEAAVLADNPLQYFPMTDPTSMDDIGPHHTVMAMDSGSVSLGVAPGPLGCDSTCASFTNAQAHAVANAIMPTGDHAFTIECWVKTPGPGEMLRFTDSTGHFATIGADGTNFSDSLNGFPLFLGADGKGHQWHYLSYIFHPEVNAVRGLIDGGADAIGAVGAVFNFSTGEGVVNIGLGSTVTGLMAHVAIYDHILTDAHLLARYNLTVRSPDQHPETWAPLDADPVDAGGTVTSVGLTMPTGFSVAGTPVTTSGTLAVSWTAESAHRVLAGPTAGSATPTFRLLDVTDIPNLDASKITTGVFGAAQIPGLDASKIVTGVLDAAHIPGLDASKIVTGLLAPSVGGTGVDSSGASPGSLLIGTGSGLSLASLTAGANIVITNSSGHISIAAASGLISPLTTKGDIWVFGPGNTRLPVGTDGFAVVADSTQPTGLNWAAMSGGGGGPDEDTIYAPLVTGEIITFCMWDGEGCTEGPTGPSLMYDEYGQCIMVGT